MTKGSAGTWLARFYDGDKYVQSPLGDLGQLEERVRFDAAKNAAEEWFEDLDMGGSVKPGTVRSACEAYVAAVKSGTLRRRHRTSSQEKNDAAAHDANTRFERLVYRDPIARIDLAKLNKHHVSGWRQRVVEAGGSAASFNRNATALRAALNYAKSLGRVPSDVAWLEALKPFDGAGERRVLYLNRDQRRKLIDGASDESKPLFTALSLLPMRPGELAALKVEQLDVAQKTLRIPTGKTEPRIVPLSAEAFSHLKACAKDKLPSAWLVSRANGSQWKKEQWRDEIKLAAAAAKQPRATVAYTLRHSTITDLVVGGLDLFTVAKLAGTSVVMIQQHYGHLQQEHARKALEKLSLMPKR
jgi:integrase